MKSVVKHEGEIPEVPCLMIDESRNLIILVSERVKSGNVFEPDQLHGVIVNTGKTGEKSYIVGSEIKTKAHKFKPFNGTVTLSNQ